MSLFHHRKPPEMGSDPDRLKYPNVFRAPSVNDKVYVDA